MLLVDLLVPNILDIISFLVPCRALKVILKFVFENDTKIYI